MGVPSAAVAVPLVAGEEGSAVSAFVILYLEAGAGGGFEESTEVWAVLAVGVESTLLL